MSTLAMGRSQRRMRETILLYYWKYKRDIVSTGRTHLMHFHYWSHVPKVISWYYYVHVTSYTVMTMVMGIIQRRHSLIYNIHHRNNNIFSVLALNDDDVNKMPEQRRDTTVREGEIGKSWWVNLGRSEFNTFTLLCISIMNKSMNLFLIR